MKLLMVSGDRQVTVGEQGPFHAMLREFSRHFERIDVLCPRPAGPVVVRTIYGHVHFHPAPCGRAGMARYLAREGTRLVRQEGHALIVSHDYGWFYNGLGSARISRRTGVPYLSELHHIPGHPVAADLRERFDKLVARCYVRWARGRAAAFRVVNAGQMPALLEGWGVPRERILVLPSLYIDLELYRPPLSPVEVRQDVLFVGRLVGNKGLDRIVAALELLARDGLRPRTLFVGKGPLAPRLRRWVRAAGLEDRVRFQDWVATPADLAQIYRESRVLVCASTCEGGPRVTVEAMAAGTPVVSTPVGVMGELLADGRAGVLVGFDARSLAQGLARLLGDEELRLAAGRAARERASAFEATRAIRAYAEALLDLARRGGRTA